ncbi:MAG: hypothetical protein VX938_06600, partial [Myxococcota bacterium]|nr:hypothetical protein [Myxococcota bacterium]
GLVVSSGCSSETNTAGDPTGPGVSTDAVSDTDPAAPDGGEPLDAPGEVTSTDDIVEDAGPSQGDTLDVTAPPVPDAEVTETDSIQEVTPEVEPPVSPCEGVQCDNGDPCDGTETCEETTGECTAGEPLVCEDDDPCTADVCGLDGCTFEPLSGTPCTLEADTPGQCVAGECSPTQSCDCAADADCDDGDPCTTDTCDADSCACGSTPVAGPCMDASNPWEVVIHYPNSEEVAGVGPTMQSLMVPIPEGTTEVHAQVAIRGDLDYFPAAFVTLLVEEEGSLKQCGDVSGLPQLPNNIVDDIYRVAWPRPANLAPSSIFYPPAPPYDFQALPCQEAFLGKSEVEVGTLAVGIHPPGTSGNQGVSACGGPGCPNDALVTLRFEPAPDGPLPCEPGAEISCICGDGSYGTDTCEADGSGALGDCACPEGAEPPVPPDEVTLGQCSDPLPFSLDSTHTEALVVIQGSSFHAVPWPPVNSACPTSKPPFSVEHFYEMEVAEAGHILIEVEGIPEPWEPFQYWIDMQMTCEVQWQCGASYQPMEGDAGAGTFLVGVTLAPPEEIYLPDQTDWELTLKATWSPPAVSE